LFYQFNTLFQVYYNNSLLLQYTHEQTLMKNQFVQTNSNKIHYLTGGQGKTLILLPSLWITSTSYHVLGSELSKYFQVIIPDIYRGKSHFNKNATNIDDYVKSLSYFVEALSLKKFYLVGVSFSGLLATKYTLKHSNTIYKLFLVSTAVGPLSVKNKRLLLILGYAKLLFHNMFSSDGIKTNILWLRDSIQNLMRHPLQVLYEGIVATSDDKNHVFDMNVPTKLLFARKDEFIPVKVLSVMEKISNLEIEVVDHYHAWFFKQEDILAKKIVAYFKA